MSAYCLCLYRFILLNRKLGNAGKNETQSIKNCSLHCLCVRDTALTIVCLEGLGLDHLTAVAAHHQVEVVLRRTLAKYWHVCAERERKRQDREGQQVSLRQQETQACCQS